MRRAKPDSPGDIHKGLLWDTLCSWDCHFTLLWKTQYSCSLHTAITVISGFGWLQKKKSQQKQPYKPPKIPPHLSSLTENPQGQYHQWWLLLSYIGKYQCRLAPEPPFLQTKQTCCNNSSRWKKSQILTDNMEICLPTFQHRCTALCQVGHGSLCFGFPVAELHDWTSARQGTARNFAFKCLHLSPS